MGLRGCRGGDGLGRNVNLREVEIDTSTNKMEPKSNRIIQTSEMTYRRLVAFSKNYNVETYDQILNDLIDTYEKNNQSGFSHYQLN